MTNATWRYSLFTLWLLSGTACGDDLVPECGEGTELVAGECLPLLGDGATPSEGDAGQTPGEDARCGEGTRLHEGECHGLRPVGAACEGGYQCATGTCLPSEEGLPGGYCTVVDCNERRPCPAGGLCYFVSSRDRNLCLAFCDDHDDCRDDYVCQSLITSDVRLCAPACGNDRDCPGPTRCDTSSGQCLLRECDPEGGDACAADSARTCVADTRGLTEAGGVCLLKCDPSDASATCSANEVCQPSADDPDLAFCAPPLCSEDDDCPAGASCEQGVCQPPPRCDDDGGCADGRVCVGGPGGQCMQPCPESGCESLHNDLRCEPSLDACLPLGSFPGSECRELRADACDALAVTRADDSIESVQMLCRQDRCVVPCREGGSALCGDVSGSLTCASGVLDVPACLPVGSFPGAPCDADGACAPLSFDGQSLAMSCAADRCAVVCDADDAGQALCQSLDDSLTCAQDLYGDGVDLCLPYGSYPGGPCGADQRCDSGLTCLDARCLSECENGGDTLCQSVSPALACAESVYEVPVCLPAGSFPGGPCGAGDACAPIAFDEQSLPMACVASQCAVVCDDTAGGDVLCQSIDASLVCADNLQGDDVDVCLPRGSFPGGPCDAGDTCDSGLSCQDARCLYDCSSGGDALCTGVSSSLACAVGVYPTPVCLPRGSFPGGPCGAGDTCAQNLGGVEAADMSCRAGVCVVDCDEPAPFPSGDALCEAINAALTCVDASAAPFCAQRCDGGCPDGDACFATDNACLPEGSFLGAPCADGTCSGEPMLVCAGSSCAAGCDTAGGTQQAQADGYCSTLGSQLGTGWNACADPGAGVEICVTL